MKFHSFFACCCTCSHRSLSKITFGNAGQPATMESSMAKGDFSGKMLGASGAIIVTSFLPKWCAPFVSSYIVSPTPHRCTTRFLLLSALLSTCLSALTSGGLTSMNLSKNVLCDIDKYGDDGFDASGVAALADAIGKHQ